MSDSIPKILNRRAMREAQTLTIGELLHEVMEDLKWVSDDARIAAAAREWREDLIRVSAMLEPEEAARVTVASAVQLREIRRLQEENAGLRDELTDVKGLFQPIDDGTDSPSQQRRGWVEVWQFCEANGIKSHFYLGSSIERVKSWIAHLVKKSKQAEHDDAVRKQLNRMLDHPESWSWEAIYDAVKRLKGM